MTRGGSRIERTNDKHSRAKAKSELEQWLQDQGATESVKFDEDTGRPMRVFSIDLTKQSGK